MQLKIIKGSRDLVERYVKHSRPERRGREHCTECYVKLHGNVRDRTKLGYIAKVRVNDSLCNKSRSEARSLNFHPFCDTKASSRIETIYANYFHYVRALNSLFERRPRFTKRFNVSA